MFKLNQFNIKVMRICSRLLAAILLLIATTSLQAEEVTQQYRGLTLNANLVLADGKAVRDGIVLIVHGLQAHNQMEIIEASQLSLLENGRGSLAINLSLGVNNRHGFYSCSLPQLHSFIDAVNEIDAWINWLKNNGARQVTLMGHSLGGTQALTYVVTRNDRVVNRLVLLAPATAGYRYLKANYLDRYEKDLDQPLDQAHKLITAGKGQQLLHNTDFFYCPNTSVKAETFYDYYRSDSNFDRVPDFLKRLQIPTLIIAASLDERQPKVVQHVAPLVDDKIINLVVIDGAGHFFRDLNLDEAIEYAVEFLL